ncbi:hypothetical protein [Glycomyces sp. NRRL B-16210]|uniref:hypothetical protein n=1 Tax=Glycomyces sp. NRRL B-16210 TaxID=1463821 RepID=UPI0004BE515F|nr:hypothetical protein [Glycomyces sp. NRRL B-16210]
MKRTFFKTLAATGAAALLLSGCGLLGDDASGDDTDGGNGGDNAVYDAMTTWDACEVLDNLQPITDYMGIEGYGSNTGTGGEPSTAKIGNAWDPEAIGCNDLIYLGSLQGFGMNGEIKVKIVPTENEEQASATYRDRVSLAESVSAQWDDAKTVEFSDPWDEGTMVSWTGDVDQPYVQVIARDGQWVFHIDLYHSEDFGLDANGEAFLPFTPEERNQWFVDTYLPDVNQTINDRIAEVQ